LPENCFDSPKTSRAKGRFFNAHRATIPRERSARNRLP
jgi:hypothetical protein